MTGEVQTITVLGAGYVGLTTAALLANTGHKVYLVEPNSKRLNTIKQGKSFFYEEGLDLLIEYAINRGTLLPTANYKESIPYSKVIISCVGTPDNPDGSSNLQYVFSAAEEAAEHLTKNSIYVQKSTVPVGTGTEVMELFASRDAEVYYVSSPEFLREGTAISDTLGFDRVVAGANDNEAAEMILDIYRGIEAHRDAIAERANIDFQSSAGIYIKTNLNSAELIKVASNAFLALKISFANSIAKLADKTGADITEVMEAVGADKRIGRSFLNAGRGYGGGCFPKDVSGLISSASEHGVDLHIMTAAAEVNESMPGYIAHKIQGIMGELEGRKIAVLGLAFKAGTSDSRRSPGVKLANILDHSGAKVKAFDPQANGSAQLDLRKGVVLCHNLSEVAEAADCVIIATDWPEFLSADLRSIKNSMSGNIFMDAVNAFDISQVQEAGLQYIGVGRSEEI